jgi:rRNA maturation endonuclease Nob1
MSTYKIFCDSCEAEFSITPLAGGDNTTPTHCAYCGSPVTEETISEAEEDWDKLLEDEWSSEEEDDR